MGRLKMELRVYLHMLVRKWWIVIPIFLITLTAIIVLTFTQTPTFETTATFVVTPNASFETIQSFVSGLDVLSRRAEIATTYAEIANSRWIKTQAADALGLSPAQRRSLSVNSQLVAGTNVIRITVTGSNPNLVRDLANMVGAQAMVYVQELYEVYNLLPLDEALRPSSPIKPSKLLNLALGAGLGLVLGVGLAFLAEYLQMPLETVTSLSILDSETGAYNKRYLLQRLQEEVSRAKRNNYPLALALMKIDHLEAVWTSPQARSEALHKIVSFVKQYIRKEDVLARYDDKVFALLLPDMLQKDAQAIMEKLLTRIAWTPFEVERSAAKLNLTGSSGVVGYHRNGAGPDELLALASQALKQAELADYGSVFSMPESDEQS